MSIELTPTDVSFAPVALDLTEGEVFELQPTDAAISPVSTNLDEQAGLRLTPTPATFAPVSALLGATGSSITLTPTAATLARVPLTLRSDPVAALPAVIPSSRVFRPSKHPQARTKAQNGVDEARLWASASGGGSLDLTFRAITDADAELIMAAHDAARGGRAALSVPSAIYEGLSATLLPYYDLTGTGLAWAFDGPPRTRSVAEGYADVEVRLRARRAARNSFVSAGVVGVDLESGEDGGTYGGCDAVGDVPDPLPIDPDLPPGDPVPTGVAQLYIWGGGGSGVKRSGSSRGGSGGYAKGQINILDGQSYVIVVGGGGNYTTGVGGFGGGGDTVDMGYAVHGGGPGGGYSGIFSESVSQANALLIAGGGGGGSMAAIGGRGGGSSGANPGNNWGGGGGTQIAGGAGDVTVPASPGQPGIALVGGDGWDSTGATLSGGEGPGSGGGGGYFGGGGGGRLATGFGPGAGGGGSGFVAGSVTAGSTTQRPDNGLDYNPDAVSDRPSSGNGLGGLNGSGINGLVVFIAADSTRIDFSVPGEYYIYGAS